MSAAHAEALPTVSLMNTEAVARYTGLSVPTLERMRGSPDGIPYFKLGSGRTSPVRYAKADVDAWLASKRRTNTGEGDGHA